MVHTLMTYSLCNRTDVHMPNLATSKQYYNKPATTKVTLAIINLQWEIVSKNYAEIL